MPYTHYGEIGDVWKHLPLCFFLKEECPNRYVESNSAFPKYLLDQTSRREYGIFHLLHELERNDYPFIGHSPYIELVNLMQGAQNGISAYLGSPGLAMELLKDRGRYLFCDIEEEPLADIRIYADEQNLQSLVQTLSGDSIDLLWSEVEQMGYETFLHIDPYRILEENDNGRSYADLFVKAAGRGVRTMLWYGYETLEQQKELHNRLQALLKDVDANLSGIDFYIGSIGSTSTEVNPGVPGCGILVANLSAASLQQFDRYAEELERVYRNASFMNKPEKLIKLRVSL
ncbi:23S rRNA (adenine(2030)-N(6))-methyltransferase RlmJ [Paenibacillus sepulcri]|uniref:23S rRNA (Adenine(2030)-N(6))-methyltransferase RlmJ n=1 Tax=Paenibacillus sepulcri TaxID=359917 RepID=A0ABS7C6B3_9BACL|nr:23S rRNA (adenine(2030)-N(6))-methyltransferase RlmJ [Paenibacillus sepulcri]